MTDIGVSCQKLSYGRGWGEVLTCKKDQEMSGALCYPPCKDGYVGNGPVCWQKCPAGKHACGALCTDSPDDCTASVKNIVGGVFSMAAIIAAGIAGGAIDVVGLIKAMGGTAWELANSICEPPTIEEFLMINH